MLNIGDWVTQYSAGYWKVIRIIPKYADSDYSYEGTSWKKGDRLGDWVILKKGLTPKMKPGNACECVDSQWCRTVSEDVCQSIKAVFAENPKAKQKFDKAPDLPKPSVASLWLSLSDEQAAALSALLADLPEKFTAGQFRTLAAPYLQFEAAPSSATHILYLFSHLWEISETFEPLHFGAELKKYQ